MRRIPPAAAPAATDDELEVVPRNEDHVLSAQDGSAMHASSRCTYLHFVYSSMLTCTIVLGGISFANYSILPKGNAYLELILMHSS